MECERQMAKNLESEFDEAMRDTYRRASEHGYNPSVFLGMINQHGGVGTAKRLLASRSYQSGLIRLRNLGLLNISSESLVLQEHWEPLFTDEERQIARERLSSHGYESP